MGNLTQLTEKLRHVLNLVDDESSEIQKLLWQEFHRTALDLIIQKYSIIDSLPPEEAIMFQKIMDAYHESLLLEAFRQLVAQSMDDVDLELAMILIAYWNNPGLDSRRIRATLDALAKEVHHLMPVAGHPLAFLDHVNFVLFGRHRFRGNTQDFYNPNNSYLDKVLESRTGIPITLAIVYLLIARRLDLPVFGVSMPAHFLLKFDNGEDEIFFDPFNEGQIYTRQQCYRFLASAHVEHPDKVLEGCDNMEILQRVLRNLRLVYSSYYDEPDRVAFLEKVLAVLSEKGKQDIVPPLTPDN